MVRTETATAASLAVGEQVLSKGHTWSVSAVKVRKKRGTVALTLAGDAGSFSADVDAARPFERVLLADAAGAQQRWATPAEAEPVTTTAKAHSVTSEQAERTVSELLGARLIGVQREGERYVVPLLDEATVYAHLLTFHGIGVERPGLDAARELGEATLTAAEALALADFGQAIATHAADHREREPDQLHVPHVHR